MASNKLAAFERALSVNRSNLIGEAHRKAFVAFARQKLGETLAEQEARSGFAPSYMQTVDGQPNAPLDAVRLGGVIRFDFRYLLEIGLFAKDYAVEHSPEDSGLYKRSWFLMANGGEATEEALATATEIILTNDQPYHRKIEVGAMTLSVPPGIVEQTRKAVLSRYGNVVKPEVRFIQLAGGYVLKRSAGRRGRRAGDPMTYPALAITVRG